MFEKNLLNNKNIIVTGGGTGIGKAITSKYAELGANVIIISRKEDVLKNTSNEINEKVGRQAITYKVCDISNPQMVQETVTDIFNSQDIHILLNNAAGNFIAKSEKLSHRAFDAISKIVYNGTAYVTLECGKKWIEKKQKASVLSIVTTYASTGSAFVLPSAMAKAGVLAMTRSLAVEWGRKGIRFNAIAPGPFPTKGALERLIPNQELCDLMINRNPLGRSGNLEELANLASYLISDFSEFINGEVVTIDGGEWLKGAGEFNFLEAMEDEDWNKFSKK